MNDRSGNGHEVEIARAVLVHERSNDVRAGRAMRRLTSYWGVVPVLAIVALFALRACLHTDPLENLAPSASDPRDPPATTARTGSLAITRGGPVVIGAQSATPFRLTIGSNEVRPSIEALRQRNGVFTQRFVIPAGTIAIRFAAAGNARLVWSPVGRRGDPEYLAAGSLSPEPPERATFDAPGTVRTDGLIALAMIVVAVATACMLARRRLARVPRATWIAIAGVLVLALVVRLVSLGDAGQTWDEDVNWAAGRNYVQNVLALDGGERSWIWNYEHPPVMKYLAGTGALLVDGFGAARALSALWVALGCALLVPIGARLYNLRTGVLAGAIAALLPPLIAHGQIVGHEAPTVLWWALGIMMSLGVHDDLPDDTRTARRTLILRLVAVGAIVGVAVASRFVNGLLGPLCAALVVIQSPAARRRATLAWGAIAMPLAALATVYALWPRLWLHPIASLQQSFAKLDTLHAPEPFLGVVTNTPGPHYFVVYLLATLPAGILALVIAWLVRSVRERDRRALVVALWFVLPLVVSASPVRQDGVRYVMPCVLAFAMMAAAGADFLAGFLERRVRHAHSILAGAVGLYLAIVVVRAHPYYLDYFGEHVGGTRTAARAQLFETAWWGEGVDRAVDYVNTHAAPDARVFRGCILPNHLAWFRQDLWTDLADPRQATWIVSYANRCGPPAGTQAVYRVTVDGVDFATVYKR
jgi:4-amino-4-deoxy-L-arabinose transferase-like glycosyltransferase